MNLCDALDQAEVDDVLECTDDGGVDWITLGQEYTVVLDDDGYKCIIVDDGDDVNNPSDCVQFEPVVPSVAAPPLTGKLRDLLKTANEGDVLECIDNDNKAVWSTGKMYLVHATCGGGKFVHSDNGDARTGANTKILFVNRTQGGYSVRLDDAEPTESDGTHDDVHDTWGIGNKPQKKVKQWEPDVPDPDVDLMKSIRDICHRGG